MVGAAVGVGGGDGVGVGAGEAVGAVVAMGVADAVEVGTSVAVALGLAAVPVQAPRMNERAKAEAPSFRQVRVRSKVFMIPL
jgi:hypothetical protein